MNCLECQDLLQRRLDGEPVAESDALEQHLAHCNSCHEQHGCAVRLAEGLKKLPFPKPPSGFAEKIAAEWIRERRGRRDKLRRRALITVILAASVALTLLMTYYFFPPRTPDGPPNKDFVEKRPPVVPPIVPAHPQKQEKAPEKGSPLTPLIDRWADTTRDHAKVVQVAMNLDAVENLPMVEKLPPIDPGVREASQEVTDGVRTVTRNARKAFDFFARELPMPEVGELKN